MIASIEELGLKKDAFPHYLKGLFISILNRKRIENFDTTRITLGSWTNTGPGESWDQCEDRAKENSTFINEKLSKSILQDEFLIDENNGRIYNFHWKRIGPGIPVFKINVLKNDCGVLFYH